MKYIVVGLGSFGAPLSQKLTAQGNEVIGIDVRMEKVELYKEKISHTIKMDATDEFTVAGLPLKDTDVVIVAIGEDEGANIMATAIFKNMQVKRLISRSINPLHEKVLKAIGVDEIVHPEEETAERWAKKLSLNNVVDAFQLSENFSVIEANVPKEYVGKTLREADFRAKFNIIVLAIMEQSEVKSAIGKSSIEVNIKSIASADQQLKENDILVIYGSNNDLKKFLKVKTK